MAVCREEVFGPVLVCSAFDEIEEVVTWANDSQYGLAASIWTENLGTAHQLEEDLEAGTVWINTYRSASFMSPFGGFKQSGYGKHNGFEGIREFSRLKNVVVDYSGNTQDPFVMKLK